MLGHFYEPSSLINLQKHAKKPVFLRITEYRSLQIPLSIFHKNQLIQLNQHKRHKCQSIDIAELGRS